MDFPLFPFDTFPNGEKVSIFWEKHFLSVWKSAPFIWECLCICWDQTGMGCQLGTEFDLAGVLYHLPYPIWEWSLKMTGTNIVDGERLYQKYKNKCKHMISEELGYLLSAEQKVVHITFPCILWKIFEHPLWIVLPKQTPIPRWTLVLYKQLFQSHT